ncbi:porin OmpC [Hafnia alvei]|uniref:porin OmpC n=1 Tax=Hafnia alvei TaxID=569 RepID=UPI00266B67CB|nr:porin OmpC [Hafnia alvei]
MKRKILAVVIPSLLIAGMAHASEIYNKDGNKLDLEAKVDARHQFSDASSQDGDETYLRVGFRGETQINDQLTGFGQWEYNVQAQTTESEGVGSNGNATRLAFAGLKFGDFGSFDYGRNYGVVYDVEAWTDMLPDFGGDSYTQTDVFMNTRANNLATYRNTNFFGLVDGLNFALQYQGANDNGGAEGNNGTNNGDRKIATQNGDGVGFSTTYDTGMGLNFGASYAASNRTYDQEHRSLAGGNTADVWTLGAKYDANNVYLAVMYAQTQNMTAFGDTDGYIANKTQNVEVTAQYQFDFGLRQSLGYVYSKGKDLDYNAGGKHYDNEDLVNYIDVGTYFYFNKNMSTYVDYKINLLDDNNFSRSAGLMTDDVVGVGLVYQF